MKQICITPVMGKRLIGMGIVSLPEIQKVLKDGTLVIIAGTTNGYVAEEIIKSLNLESDFKREGFRRGITTGPDNKIPNYNFNGDLVFEKGKLLEGKTIFDVSSNLTKNDVILKGANAFDSNKIVGIQVAHPEGGTIHEALKAVYGKRTTIIYPVGMEKRIPGDLRDIAEVVNAPDSSGTRLYLCPGNIFTELDALTLITGVKCLIMAAGGVYGAEGSILVALSGTEEQEKNAVELIKSISNEKPCEV